MKCCLKPSKKSVMSKICDKQNPDAQGLPVSYKVGLEVSINITPAQIQPHVSLI